MNKINVDYIDGRSSVEYPDILVLSPEITVERLCQLQKELADVFQGNLKGLMGVNLDMEIYTTPQDCEYDYDTSHVYAHVLQGDVYLEQCFMRQVGVEDRLISDSFLLSGLIDYMWRKERIKGCTDTSS